MLHRDNRGLALALVSFIALLVISALLYTLLNPAFGDINTMLSSQSDDPTVQNQLDLAERIWGLILFFILFLGSIALIARATFESRSPR